MFRGLCQLRCLAELSYDVNCRRSGGRSIDRMRALNRLWVCKAVSMGAKIVLLVLLISPLSTINAADESPFEWNLFGTFGFSYTGNLENIERKNVPYSYLESGISLKPLSKLAFQASYRFTEKLDFTVQAVARGFEDFEPEAEWIYLKYDVLDDLSFRIGRFRRPLFIHSDSYNVAYSYPWARPPGVTYFEFSGLYQSIDAIDLIYTGWLGSWGFSAEGYYGKGRSDTGYIRDILTTYSSDDSYGFVLGFEKNDFSVSMGHHLAEFSVDLPIGQQAVQGLTQLGFSALADPLRIENKQSMFSNLGGMYRFDNWQIEAELTHLGSDDSILTAVSSGYLGASWINKAYTYNYTIGAHRSRSNGDFATPISQAAQGVASANTPESAIAAGVLNGIAAGLAEYLDANENTRISHRLGVRYDERRNSALKAEVEWIEDEGSSGGTATLNLSIDFVY